MTAPALIARCPRCNETVCVVTARDLWTGDVLQVFEPHGECRYLLEAGEVLEDTPANREALEAKWAGEKVCPECLQRPARRKGLCGACAGLMERPRFNYRRPVRRFGGRR